MTGQLTPKLPYVSDCAECAQLNSAEQEARSQRDPSKETDYRVLARRHLRTVHQVTVVVEA